LHLTEAQQAQAREAFQQAAQNAGARPGSDASQSERRAYQRRIRDAAIQAIEPSLTAEQKQALQQMRNAPQSGPRETIGSAVIYVMRENKPTPVRVQIGVADDSYTAIRGGDLREGDQVITGGGPQPDNASSGQRGQGQGQGQGGNRQGGPGANPLGGGGAPRIRGL
jgi:HlyD family secretion protein